MKDRQTMLVGLGAGNRGRTGTILSYHGILSPGRLPIPPHRQRMRMLTHKKDYIIYFCFCQTFFANFLTFSFFEYYLIDF